MNRRVIIPVMARELITWYKNHLAVGQTMQWISFLNDVISLFFLPQCVVCHPAKCFYNVTISLQRAHYGNYDSLSTKWPQKGEFHLWLFVSFISRYGFSGQTANSSGSQYQPYNKPKTKQYKDRRASPRGQQQQQDMGKKHGRKTPETDRTTNEQ